MGAKAVRGQRSPKSRPRSHNTRAGEWPFIEAYRLHSLSTKRADTVGQPSRAEIWVSKMPSLKAKKLRKLP